MLKAPQDKPRPSRRQLRPPSSINTTNLIRSAPVRISCPQENTRIFRPADSRHWTTAHHAFEGLILFCVIPDARRLYARSFHHEHPDARPRLAAATSTADWRGVEPQIKISSNVILLSQDQGGAVTVHTNIPLSRVKRASVALEGIPALSTYADAQGNLAAEFPEAMVKDCLEPEEPADRPFPAELSLNGEYRTGGTFDVPGTVLVRP